MGTNVETRSYRILGLLGEGGFGKVYRARMEGAGGFSKDVAVKLLAERDPPTSVLERFRDESRILGLVRDRAVIGVEPPSELGGRWAVIMEFVDGASGSRLLREHGPLPPRVAVDIVREVARSLENIYRQLGPDGEPLELVHRDLKPANIQVTPAGEVKILDFGTARARFETREATTTRSIAGTYGYIAPERLHGIDTPAGDIYSLGYVLYRLVTAGKADPPSMREAHEASEGELRKVLDLAMAMAVNDYEQRPSSRDLEERCARLAHELEGPSLLRWAQDHVHHRDGDPDALVGRVLTTTFSIENEASQEITAARSRTGLVLLGLTGVNLVLAGVGLGVLAMVGLVVVVVASTRGGEPEPPVAVPTAVPVVQPVAPVQTPLPTPAEPAAPDDGDEPPVDDEVEDEPPAPAPAAPAPEPEPEPRVARYPVDFGSQPLGAEVFLDGRSIGTTPLFGYHVPAGRHRVRMLSGSRESSFSIDVGRRKPKRYIWKGGDDWEALY